MQEKTKYLIIAAVAIVAGVVFNNSETPDTIAALLSAVVAFMAAYKANRIITREEEEPSK